MKIKVNFKKIFAYIFGFILLYQPNYPININLILFSFKINNYVVLLFFILAYLIVYIIHRKNIFKVFTIKRYFKFAFLIFCAAIYYVCRTTLAGTSFFDIKNIRIVQNLFPIAYLLGALIINNELNEMEYSFKDKCKFLIHLGLIQSAIALLMLVIPSFKNIAIYIYSQGSENVNIYVARSRLHGICDGDYTYSLQILHGMMALLCLIFAYVYNEKRYYLYTIPILLVTFLNGRSGLIIFVVGIALFILFMAIKSHSIVKLFKLLFIVIIMGFVLYKVISVYMPSAANLVMHAVKDVMSFSDGNTDTETSQLYNMVRFPKGQDFIIGKGYRVYGQKGILYGDAFFSDIGFVNDVYMGGVIYCVFLYGAYLALYKKVARETDDMVISSFCKILLVSLILANIKGEVFRSVMLQVFDIFVAVLMTLDKPIKKLFTEE